jgi:hypothetical protein
MTEQRDPWQSSASLSLRGPQGRGSLPPQTEAERCLQQRRHDRRAAAGRFVLCTCDFVLVRHSVTLSPVWDCPFRHCEARRAVAAFCRGQRLRDVSTPLDMTEGRPLPSVISTDRREWRNLSERCLDCACLRHMSHPMAPARRQSVRNDTGVGLRASAASAPVRGTWCRTLDTSPFLSIV